MTYDVFRLSLSGVRGRDEGSYPHRPLGYPFLVHPEVGFWSAIMYLHIAGIVVAWIVQ
jgi:hypothetical protein